MNPTVALMQMLVSRVITLSFNRWRISSLQSRKESSDAERVVDVVAVFDGLLGLGLTWRDHRRRRCDLATMEAPSPRDTRDRSMIGR